MKRFAITTYVDDPEEGIKGLGEVRLDVRSVTSADAPVVAELLWKAADYGSGTVSTLTQFHRFDGDLYRKSNEYLLSAALHEGGILDEQEGQRIRERCKDASENGRKPTFDATGTRLGIKIAGLAGEFLVINNILHEKTDGPVICCVDTASHQNVDGNFVIVPSVALRWSAGTSLGVPRKAVFGHDELDLAIAFASAPGMPGHTMELKPGNLRVTGELPPRPDYRAISIRYLAGAAYTHLGSVPLRRIPRQSLAALHALRSALKDVYGIDPARMVGMPGKHRGTGFSFAGEFPHREIGVLALEAINSFADVGVTDIQAASHGFLKAGLAFLSPAPQPVDAAMDDYDEAALSDLGGFSP